ncbi:endo-1,4-beta-xylanase [Streptomyces sp. NPDC056210]|uniref:endo-1,4-beta-xylanase n=2 Tax=unclassified Streptomyces TaxID=2593676 RepID=UPI0035D6E5F2
MIPVRHSMPVGPGRLPGQLLSAYAPVSPLRGVPAPAAEQGSPHDLAVAHAKYFDSATDNLESPNTVYAATLGSESGQITPGNSMTWETTEPQLAQFTFAKGDVITGITRDHGQAVRGHTLVRHSELPGWIGSLPPAHVQAAMTHHITEAAGHYKSEVAAWDIAHEPLSDDGTFRTSPLHNAWGSGYIAAALRAAYPAAPGTGLSIDGCNTEGPGAESNAMYNLVSDLVADGAPIYDVEFQGHRALQYGSPGGTQQNLQRFADLRLDGAVTKLVDVRMRLPADATKLATQTTYYRNVIEACLAVAWRVGITAWDHIDKFSWVPSAFPGQGAASLHDENVRPKAAYATVPCEPGGGDEGSAEPGALKAQYRTSNSAPGDHQTKPALELVNTRGTAVDLSTMKVRHWITDQSGVTTNSTRCDWSPLGCSSITHRAAAMSSPKAGADHCLEIGFGSGSLAAGASTG